MLPEKVIEVPDDRYWSSALVVVVTNILVTSYPNSTTIIWINVDTHRVLALAAKVNKITSRVSIVYKKLGEGIKTDR